MSRRKLFIIFLFSCLFLTALFYFSSGKDVSKDSEDSILLNPVKYSDSNVQKLLSNFFKTSGFKKPEEVSFNYPTEKQIKFMSDEVYDNFDYKTGSDIIIILKDSNEYVLDTYNQDYEKKKKEIKILIDEFLESFSEEEIEVRYKGEVTKFIAAHVNSKDVLKKIQEQKLFGYFFLDKKQELHLLESKQVIGVNNFQATYMATGGNVSVCVIDSGIDYAHPAFGTCGLTDILAGTCQRISGGIDFQSTTSGGIDNDPLDPIMGHGTQVAGVIASNDPSIQGIAPDADIVAVKIFHGPIGGGFSTTMAGIDWCVNNRNSFRTPIKVITMSFGTGSYDSSTTPFYYDSSFVSARAAGIFLDASSGNAASHNGISYPASSPLVFSVGSYYDSNLGYMSFTGNCEDQNANLRKISCFTNRYDLLDILAPGSAITTTTKFGGFTTVSGTSVAAAHVAAVAALLFSFNPNYSVKEIEHLMRNTGVSTFDPESTYSYPLLNLQRLFVNRPNPTMNLAGEPNAGSSIEFSYFDPKNVNHNYLFLLSGSNTPPIILPSGVIPLAFDNIMYNALVNPLAYSFFNSFGLISSFGHGKATLNLDPNLVPGTTFYAGAISFNNLPFPNNILGISKSIKITVLPAIVDMALHSNLPGNLAYPSCVNNFFNGKIYCLGGEDYASSSSPLDQILEFDPISGSLIVKSSVTPAGIVESSCVNDFYTGSGLLCFGGFTNTGGRWVFSYDSINDVVTTKSAVLPNSPHWRATSCAAYPFSQQDESYCFGGITSLSFIDSIVKYSASADTFTYMASTLPEQMSYMSCVTSFAYGKIYCFGGIGHTSQMPSSKILEYDPLTDTLAIKSARLPKGMERLSCTENTPTGKIYCFGGRDITLTGYPDRVLEYDPLTDMLQVTYTRMSPGRAGHSCTFGIDLNIYCFGGEQVDESQGTVQSYNEILVY